MRSRKRREQTELAQIRAKAVADAHAVDEALRPGFGWVGAYPGQILGRSLTCDDCGAVVTLQTQDQHTAWHDSISTLARTAVADAITAVRSKLNYESEKPA